MERKRRKVTLEIEEKILKLYKDGISAEEIGRKLELGATTIRRYLDANKIKKRGVKEAKGGLSDEKELEVKKLYETGLTTETLGKKFGVSGKCIGDIVRRQGGKILTNTERNGIPKSFHKDICEDYKNGKSKRELARDFEKDISVITKILKDNNIEERTLSEAAGGLPTHLHKSVCDDYINGLSCEKIALKHSVSDRYINNLLIEGDIERRNIKEAHAIAGRGINLTDKEVCDLYKDGYSSSHIVQEYGGSPSTVLRILSKNNIEIRENIGSESVLNVIKKEGNFAVKRNTDFYIYNLDGFDEYLKIGIAFNHDDRAEKTKGIYTDYEMVKTFDSREEAFFMEQAILEETLKFKDCPRLLRKRIFLVGCSGAEEVRKVNFDYLENCFNFFYQELLDKGLWLFGVNYVPMTKEEKEMCLKNIDI